MRNKLHTLLTVVLLSALAALGPAPALALAPNGTRTVLLTAPNVSVNFRDRIESLTATTVYYEIIATDDLGHDPLPLYIHLTTPERYVPKDFRYRATLRNLSENGRLVFALANSSSGPLALLRINCWIDPDDKYILSVQCPPSWKSGLWRDWKPQLWATFRASHGQFYDYSYPPE